MRAGPATTLVNEALGAAVGGVTNEARSVRMFIPAGLARITVDVPADVGGGAVMQSSRRGESARFVRQVDPGDAGLARLMKAIDDLPAGHPKGAGHISLQILRGGTPEHTFLAHSHDGYTGPVKDVWDAAMALTSAA